MNVCTFNIYIYIYVCMCMCEYINIYFGSLFSLSLNSLMYVWLSLNFK